MPMEFAVGCRCLRPGLYQSHHNTSPSTITVVTKSHIVSAKKINSLKKIYYSIGEVENKDALIMFFSAINYCCPSLSWTGTDRKLS